MSVTKKKILLITPSRIIARGIASILEEHGGFSIETVLTDLSRENEATVRDSMSDIIIVDPVIFDYASRPLGRSRISDLTDAAVVAAPTVLPDDESMKNYDETISIYDTPAAVTSKLRNSLAHSTGKSPAENREELSAREKEILVCVTAAVMAAILSIIPLNTLASDKADSSGFRFRGYTGGMMLHSGYIQSCPFQLYSYSSAPPVTIQIKGGATGIGGHVKFAFGTPTDMIRIGAEGHSSNVSYRPSPSYSHTGWGGVLIDYLHRSKGRVHPFAGLLIGGGGVKNHIITEGSTEDFLTERQAAMHKYAFMAVAPFAGIEVSLTQKLSLVFKADWLFNTTRHQSDFSSGLRRTLAKTHIFHYFWQV